MLPGPSSVERVSATSVGALKLTYPGSVSRPPEPAVVRRFPEPPRDPRGVSLPAPSSTPKVQLQRGTYKRHRRTEARTPGRNALERAREDREYGTEPYRVRHNQRGIHPLVVPADSEFLGSAASVRMRPACEDAVYDDASSHPFR